MFYWLTFILVFIADQISKWWIISTFSLGESRAIIDGVLWLTYVQNRGAAFSMMQGKSVFFIIASIIVIIAMAFYVLKYRPPRAVTVIVGLISGGAAGNLLDRLQFAYVIDFFDLHWFPVFNIADTALVIGGFLLFIYVIKEERSERLDG